MRVGLPESTRPAFPGEKEAESGDGTSGRHVRKRNPNNAMPTARAEGRVGATTTVHALVSTILGHIITELRGLAPEHALSRALLHEPPPTHGVSPRWTSTRTRGASARVPPEARLHALAHSAMRLGARGEGRRGPDTRASRRAAPIVLPSPATRGGPEEQSAQRKSGRTRVSTRRARRGTCTELRHFNGDTAGENREEESVKTGVFGESAGSTRTSNASKGPSSLKNPERT